MTIKLIPTCGRCYERLKEGEYIKDHRCLPYEQTSKEAQKLYKQHFLTKYSQYQALADDYKKILDQL